MSRSLFFALLFFVASVSSVSLCSSLSTFESAQLPRRGFPPRIDVDSNRTAGELLSRGEINLVFIKNFKCASSTASGIARNIGDRRGYHATRNRWNFKHEPGVWADHTPAIRLAPHLSRLQLADYFLLSFVRDPLQKCLSFFYMTNNEMLTSETATPEQIDAALIKRLCGRCTTAHTHYLNMQYSDEDDITTHEQIDAILAAYNLVGVVERFDESLIVLKHLLGLSYWDILYISAKIAGDPVMRSGYAERPKYEERPAVKAYIENQWKAATQLEYYLVARANTVLDELVRGIPTFEVDLLAFKKLERLVYSECYSEVNTTDCLHRDNGCGISCFDRIEQRFTGSSPIRPPSKQYDGARSHRRQVVHTALVLASFILLGFVFFYDRLRSVPFIGPLL